MNGVPLIRWLPLLHRDDLECFHGAEPNNRAYPQISATSRWALTNLSPLLTLGQRSALSCLTNGRCSVASACANLADDEVVVAAAMQASTRHPIQAAAVSVTARLAQVMLSLVRLETVV